VLPDATYTSRWSVGRRAQGFLDALGAGLDGLNNGGHCRLHDELRDPLSGDDQTGPGIPDFARGPDDSTPIKVPNDSAAGIPITLYNAIT